MVCGIRVDLGKMEERFEMGDVKDVGKREDDSLVFWKLFEEDMFGKKTNDLEFADVEFSVC